MCCGKAKIAQIARAHFKKLLKQEQELHDARISICEQCENLQPNRYCKLCGCDMDAKTRLKEETCEIGKW